MYLYLDVLLSESEWDNFSIRVLTIYIEPHTDVHPDLVIPTVDSVCNEDLIFSLLNEHKLLILRVFQVQVKICCCYQLCANLQILPLSV